MLKKCTLFLVVLGLLSMSACGTRPTHINSEQEQLISAEIENKEKDGYHREAGDRFAEAHRILACCEGDLKGKRKDACITVYFYYVCGYYAPDGENRSGCAIPAAMVLCQNGSTWDVEEFWQPRDGAYYDEDLKATFPTAAYLQLPDTAEEHNELVGSLEKEIEEKLK
ncbi:MAG: hypothetical protein IJJ41_04525 [Clostridia bacterium]|nr:hypothetical protein [Clostridia bacterium]